MASILDYIGGNVIEAGIHEAGKWANKDIEKLKIEEKYYSKLLDIEKELQLKQGDINLSESKAKSLFIAGWRPAIGWLSVFILSYIYAIQPFLHSLFKAYNVDWELVTIDGTLISNLVISMLGIAGLRTYEKVKKIDTKEIK